MPKIVFTLSFWFAVSVLADDVDEVTEPIPTDQVESSSEQEDEPTLEEVESNPKSARGRKNRAARKYRGKPIFHFRRGDVRSLNVESISRTRQVEHSWRHAVRIGSLGGTGRANAGYAIPEVNKAGDLVAVRSKKATPKHTMFRVVSPRLYKGGSLKLDRTYRFAMRLRPVNHQKWPEGWVIAFQVWGPTYPANAKWKNPPLFVRVNRGQWQVGIKGGDPRNANVKERIFSWPFDSREQAIEIYYRPSATNGLFRVVVGGQVLGQLTGTTCCTHDSERGGVVSFGHYGAVGAGFAYRELLVEEL